MQQAHVGIIIGSTREGRFSERPAHWLHAMASARGDAQYETIDLRDFPLPFFDELASPSVAPSCKPVAMRWSAKLVEQDAFIVVTPEYNFAPPAVLKNAFDYAYKELNRKPIAFVGDGGVGAARAVQQLRLIASNFQMTSIRPAVHIGLAEFVGLSKEGRDFTDFPHLEATARLMLDDLAWWTRVLMNGRTATEKPS